MASPPETPKIYISLVAYFSSMNNGIPRNGNPSTHACAACKYQRRKCGPNCTLAAYFPPDRQSQFLNAHKLFGVRKIINFIKHLAPHDKDQAMRTIIYQSDMRATDPVGGCYRCIQDLQAQIHHYSTELHLVLQQLAIFREQALQQQQAHVYNPTITLTDEFINTDTLLSLYNPAASVAAMPCYHYLQQVPHQDHNINSNSTPSHEDVITCSMQNSTPLSSLSLQGKDGDASGGDEYDHKPMVESSTF